MFGIWNLANEIATPRQVGTRNAKSEVPDESGNYKNLGQSLGYCF